MKTSLWKLDPTHNKKYVFKTNLGIEKWDRSAYQRFGYSHIVSLQ